METSTDLIDQYVAVWNEPDAVQRRRRIAEVWVPNGTTCYRLLDARGYEAIEARVTGSWDRWLRERKYVFRAVTAVSHHQAMKFDFAMISTGDGRVEAKGLSYLLLNDEGRIVHDFQFNPSANDALDLAQDYLTSWYDRDAKHRLERIEKLWAGDGTFFAQNLKAEGPGEIGAAAGQVLGDVATRRLAVSPVHQSQRHHNVAQFGWRIAPKEESTPRSDTSALLIFDDRGRISTAYHFDVPETA
jgi:hypothetical protein